MKKALLILLCFGTICSITACGNGNKGGKQTAKGTPSVTKVNYEAEQKTAQADNTVDIAKEPVSSSAPDKKPDVSSNEKSNAQEPMTESKKTEKKETEKEPEKQDMEYQALGEKLLKELKNKTTSKITVFNDREIASFMGYEPLKRANKFLINNKAIACTEIEDVTEISSLKKSLKIDRWQVDTLKTCSMPNTFIYFDSDLHINLEAQLDKSWMSINSSSGRVTYLVPNDVYNTLFEKYGK